MTGGSSGIGLVTPPSTQNLALFPCLLLRLGGNPLATTGRALSEKLAAQGLNVVIVALDQPLLHDVHAKLAKEYTHQHVHAHMRTHARTHTQVSHTQTHTRTRTHTHTHRRSFPKLEFRKVPVNLGAPGSVTARLTDLAMTMTTLATKTSTIIKTLTTPIAKTDPY